ncbi:NACHT domain- and WD repeat-containing protein 1-like [Dendronephthya gigantea]|uniref:NACHT domain- and WD repeat-containing protein 1-like n=1 Tax=Dendronephthya gigantea TaxID=151771 RepID=UPI00106CE16E|nr:NACHT domain- and WD repeat-containing protein 1-like [Dendronephthya gigantea]
MEDDGEPEEEYETWDGKKVKVEYSGTKLKALRGNMNIEYPEKTQIVRIFTSSTFTDTSVERNTLMETVYPKLKIFCQKKGFEFQVVDMRWGVRDEATDDHMTTELCMKELYACQKVSTGPNFITFLGQKYGYRPFPAKIEENEFQQLIGAVDGDEDRATLQRWFRLDSNAVPREYILQPVTSILPNYRNESNQELRKAASSEWWTCFERMQMALRKAAMKTLGKNEQQKYVMSVTEDEIRRGIITATEPEKHCFWFKRVISDLNENIADKKAGSFIDKVWGQSSADKEAQEYLNTLREVDLPKVLPKKNTNTYNVKWSTQGIDPKHEQSHDQYIKNLCQDFHSVLTKMIEEGIAEKLSKERSNDEEIFDEVFQHGIFCQKKCKSFHGREPFLEDIRNEIENGSTTVILHGESGCGKTSVMAKLASSVKKWIGDPKATLILRFIGTTANSFAIRDLLKSICVQLYKATGHQIEDMPDDLKSLKEYLNTCLELAADKHPVILILDSLDQLSGDDGGLQLEWLPKTLPSNVYMILSTLPEEQYLCLPKLKMHFPANVFKGVPKMNKEEAGGILDKWLGDAKRSLTSQQRQTVLDTFNKCPLPLFLKLSFDEACRWKSYTPEGETKLPSTIREIIHSLFDRLERIHGKMLVSHALAYISASKNGLTESELEDLLSLDDDVLNDVYQYWTPPVRRLPPLIWLRVRSDLGDYLVERGSDGARVSFWYHRQFIEVSRERYLEEHDSVKVHFNIAEYFQGLWSDGKKKPFVNKQGEHLEMDRLVAQQPLMYDVNEDSVVFNKRKLGELPYHLLKSNQLTELKEAVLCNYEFLLAKLRALSCSLLMDDFRMAVNVYPEDEELQLLYDTISLSVNALTLEPRQLSSQLIGRLFNMQDDDSSNPSIYKLLQQLRSSSPVPYFVPHAKCLTSSGGPLLHAIAEHDESYIDSICLSHDNADMLTVIRGDEGLEVRIFNVRAGLLERKLILTEPVPQVYTVWHTIMSRHDKQKLVMVGGRHLLIFHLKSAEMIHQIEALGENHEFNQTSDGIPPVALGNGDHSLASFTDEGIKVWNMETGKLEFKVSVKGVDTKESMGALDASRDYVAYCKKGSTDVTVISITSGKVIHTIKSSVEKSSGAYVKFIKLTDQGKLLIMSSNSTELKVYDATSGKLLQNVAGFNANTTIKELLVTNDGKKLICQDKFDIAIWDMESWKCRKVLSDMANYHSHNLKTNDGRIFVHANVTDRIVRVYDASKDDGKETKADTDSTNQWSINQINALYPSVDNRHFITIGSTNMGSEISIWDVNQGKQVRVFKKLMFYPSVLRMASPTLGVAYIYNEKMNHYAVVDFAEGKVVRQLEGKACKRMYMMDLLDEERMVSFTRGRRHLKDLEYCKR